MRSGINHGMMVIEYRCREGKGRAPGSAGVARILLVDDEVKLRRTLSEGLRLEGWQVDCAASGAGAQRLFEATGYDLLVIDWMLPDFDGIELLQRVRARNPEVPVIMITARNVHTDQAVALAHGANDYVTKPFAFADLVTRCRTLLVPEPPNEERVIHGEVELDLGTRILRCHGARIPLTEIETALLKFLLRNVRDIATTDMLSRQVWKEAVLSHAVHAALEMQMSLLMDKIASRSGVPLIQAVAGVGYTIDASVLRVAGNSVN